MTHHCSWGLRSALRADCREYGVTPAQAVLYCAVLHNVGINIFYRIGHTLAMRGYPRLAQVTKALVMLLWSADISPSACLGPGLTIAHSAGIVIGSDVQLGRRCKLFSSVVLGGNDGRHAEGRSMPTVGDDVMICSSAAVVGPVTIGSRAVIGAHSLVFRDVPCDARVKGGTPEQY